MKTRRWKVVALLAFGAIIGISMTATPAVGHVSDWVHNWNQHIKPKADPRYINVNEMTRLSAGQITGDVDDWNGSTIADSRTIKAPKRGLLLINYTFNFGQDANETGSGRGYVTLTPKLNGSVIGDTAYESIDFSAACCDYGGFGVQRAVVVAPGTHTVSVEAGGPGGSQLVYVFERSLSVMWVPFNGNGVTPAFAAAMARGSGAARSGSGQ